MFLRMKRLAVFSALLVAPACAQFGVAGGNRKAGTNFQDLQELAKQKAAGGSGAVGGEGGGDDVVKLEDMWKHAMDNPEYLKTMGELGEQMMKMSPEELKEQMEVARKMMTDGDLVENIVNQKDEVIKSLEASGAVPPEELARFKADPAYFELKMRESFQQMGELFQNPEVLTKAAEVLQDMSKLMGDPSAVDSVMKMMGAEYQDEEKIEATRLQFLEGDFGGVPGFKEAFETPEMQSILKDPVKWRETVKEGFEGLMGMGGSLRDGANDEL